ncbi:MAG: DUF4446 family protein [Tissierellia bacterium]|nr:DUF4446 family protein [Tissierellia bacterium]
MVGIYVLIVVLIVLVVFAYTLIFGLRNKLKRQKRRYDKLLRGANKDMNMEEVLLKLNKDMNSLEQSVKTVEQDVVDQGDKTIESFTKTGIYHYDAIEGQVGKLSFSLALLDNFDNGIVLTSIYANDNSRVYLKRVSKGQITTNASPEEVQSVEMAINKK